MAEVAGLLLSPFIQAFFEKVASREFVDFFQRRKLDEDLLNDMKIALLSVNGVLEDAEEKQVKSSTVKTWLDELKDAVYEAEDILDEIDTEALRSKLDAEFQTTDSKVRKFISTSLNAFAKQIEPKMKKVLKRLENLVKQKDVIGLKQGVGEKSSEKRPTTPLFDESGIFGRIEEKEEIIESLLSYEVSGKGLCVITIVGMGGIGKTTLAQLVYDDNRVKEHFDLKAWVCVSNEFDVIEITKTILETVGSPTDSDRKNQNLLQVTLKEKLMGKKFLIVLDDVWSENYADWEALSNPFTYGAQGSKVIVTTRGEHVAVAMRSTITHRLKQLPEEDCWSLFAKHAFRDSNLRAYPKLQAIGREIVNKCHGLPLAAKAVGSLLWSKVDINEWNMILKSELWDLQNDMVIPALRLSYQYLPFHIKRCFAYCSIFPQDYEFAKEELILLWMAEGFLQQSKDKTLEQVGDDYFCDLVARSLLEQKSYYGMTYFVMHDLVNDLARLVSGQFFFRLEGDNYFEIQNKARHFSTFKESFDDVRKLETLCKAKRMRTFLPINDFQNQILTYKEQMLDLLPMLRCLRVLSLSQYKNVIELPDSISKVKHLRYLDLSKTSIRKLPDSICKLCNLQTLKLSWCKYLTVLPREMHKLVNLRHLIFMDTPIKEMPTGLGSLRSLQTLTKFIVSKRGGSSVGELGKLANLRGRLSISGLQNVVSVADALDPGLKNMQYLEELELEWDADSCIAESQSIVVFESLQPHSNLEELTISGYSGRSFPDWVGQSSLSNITSISLRHCKYCCALPPFGQLPSLESLDISGFNEITTVGPEFYSSGGSSIQSFGALKSLCFRDMPEWENWISCFSAGSEHQSFFNNLQSLTIRECTKLTGALPIHLPSLDRLKIQDCPRLVASLPRAPGLKSLVLRNSNGVPLQELPAGLQSLKIDGYDALESLPEGIIDSNGCLLSTLNELQISNCRKLELPMNFSFLSLRDLEFENSCDSFTCLPLNFISKLNRLRIMGCRNLESLEQHEHDLVATSIYIGDCPKFVSFPNGGLRAPNLTIFFLVNCPEFVSFPGGGLRAPNLTSFYLDNCPRLTSLPDKIHTLLPSLQYLDIRDCPEIESFPNGGLPSTLIHIFIVNCDKLVSSRMRWGLQKLHSLEIRGKSEDVKSFPVEGLLPNSLTRLTVSDFPNMESLDKKGLRHLTSLRYLNICRCPKFKFLPEEGLPTSLGSLSISFCPEFKFLPESGLPANLGSLEIKGCPSLEKQLKRKKGKEWRRIAHVPFVKIDDEVI